MLHKLYFSVTYYCTHSRTQQHEICVFSVQLLTQGQRYTAAMKCVVRARRELTAKTSTTATSSGGADTSASSEDKPARKVLASAGISAGR